MKVVRIFLLCFFCSLFFVTGCKSKPKLISTTPQQVMEKRIQMTDAQYHEYCKQNLVGKMVKWAGKVSFTTAHTYSGDGKPTASIESGLAGLTFVFRQSKKTILKLSKNQPIAFTGVVMKCERDAARYKPLWSLKYKKNFEQQIVYLKSVELVPLASVQPASKPHSRR